ncbi:DNA-binding transcriptional response regulator [Athalassotoga saccharophila]|uniref:hypothetical protein n=1 Tax=Athalassotoga saccharophila TaxID=1441386 RepID=UPI00137ADAC9|nr:hypothetical protein [Athalassotoga saccharophila]BBJ28914.1 hypothetical protein ATHSA_1836 [Athalassotoga saccharophila]
MNILVPLDLDKQVNFDHKNYTKIEEEIYSQFWDLIVVENKDDFEIASKFVDKDKILYAGENSIEGAIRVSKADVGLFVEIFVKMAQRENEIEVLKKNQDLLFEPINLSSKMSVAYDKLSKIAKSRASIVIAKDGLLEEWILSKIVGDHDTLDFKSIQEEEVMLNLFGTANHLPKLLKHTLVVLTNCDDVSSSLLFKMAMAVSTGRFSSYGTDQDQRCNSRILFHFVEQQNIPKPLIQIAGLNTVVIPSLEEISEDIPMIFRYVVSMMAQNTKNSSLNFSENINETLKKEKWPENWRSFFNFCKAFIGGEVTFRRDIKEISEIPKMKDYMEGIIREGEMAIIKRAMEIYKKDKKKISEALGINVKTLNKKIKIYNLK